MDAPRVVEGDNGDGAAPRQGGPPAAPAAPAAAPFPAAPELRPWTQRTMHFGMYSVLSCVLLCVWMWKEWLSARGVFYVAVMNLTHSKAANLLLGNVACVFLLAFARGIKAYFLGPLRDVEVEHLTERLSGSVMDTLLAITIFRAELSMSFAAQFVALMFVKSFHWLVQKRADYVGQTPVSSVSIYLRLGTLQCLLLLLDVACAWSAVAHLRQHGANIQLLFAFEYGLLATSLVSVLLKFALTLYDMILCQGRWDTKSVVFLYVDFALDMVQVLVYLLFFAAVLVNYGLPLHIIRQIHQTFMSFQRRIGDLLRYRRATRHLQANFPDANSGEIESAHNVCCICREELAQGAKKLPNCGHVMHLRCLRGWLEHQQRCPICRTPVLFEDLEPDQQRLRLEQLARPTEPVRQEPQAGAQAPPTSPAPSSSTARMPESSAPLTRDSPSSGDLLNAVIQLQAMLGGMHQQIMTVQDQLDLIMVSLAERGAAQPAPPTSPTDTNYRRDSSTQASSENSESADEHPSDVPTEDDVRQKRMRRFSQQHT